MKLKRTNNCGQLDVSLVGQEVILNGWVKRVRNLGGLVFVDLRDRYGVTQVLSPKGGAAGADPSEFMNEWVVAVRGKIQSKQDSEKNAEAVEVHAIEFEVLNKSQVLPFTVSENDPSTETTKLKYRYIDLRNNKLQKNFMIRHQMLQDVRKYLDKNGFLELETPTLTKSPSSRERALSIDEISSSLKNFFMPDFNSPPSFLTETTPFAP